MTPQLEALAMLNNMFESYDGRPVENAVLTRRDYALLAQALTARTTFALPEELRIEIKAMPFIRLLRNQRDEVAAVLRSAIIDYDSCGELLQVTLDRARAILAECPSYEQQLQNVCNGLGITVEELKAALARVPSTPLRATSEPCSWADRGPWPCQCGASVPLDCKQKNAAVAPSPPMRESDG